MERWSGKVAVVTGASAGIGRAIAAALARHGMKVVAMARREQALKELQASCKGPGEITPIAVDLMKEDEITSAFKRVKKEYGRVDVLVNNAAVALNTQVTDFDMAQWKKMFDLNVMAIGYCTKETMQIMNDAGIDDGHIININSIVGQRINGVPGTYIYSATKHALNLITEGMRVELRKKKSNIKITIIRPGCVRTPMVEQGNWDHDDVLFKDLPMLKSEDVAEVVVQALSAPPNVQVYELVIKPLGEAILD